MILKLSNACIITLNKNNDIIENSSVLIDNGKIVKIGNCDNDVFTQEINCCGNILMPSLVNGFINFDSPYESQIKNLICNGVTNICYFGRISNEFLTYVKTNNLNVTVAINLNKITDLTEYSIKEEIDKLDNTCEPALFISDVLNFMDNEFETVIKFVKKYGTLLICNISNNLKEVGICHNEMGLTPVGLLESFGILDLNPILTPLTSIDKDDINILKKYDVNVVTLPFNELKNGDGIAPITSLLNDNINVCLGTYKNNNLFNELRLCSAVQNGYMCEPEAISIFNLLKMISVNGFKTFNKYENAIELNNFANLIVVEKSFNIIDKNNLKDFIFQENKKVLFNMSIEKILFNNLN